MQLITQVKKGDKVAVYNPKDVKDNYKILTVIKITPKTMKITCDDGKVYIPTAKNSYIAHTVEPVKYVSITTIAYIEYLLGRQLQERLRLWVSLSSFEKLKELEDLMIEHDLISKP